MLRIDDSGGEPDQAQGCEVIHLHRALPGFSPPPPEELDHDLDADELLAAYLAKEAHVMPILRLLMDMDDAQRQLSLSLLHCVAMGTPQAQGAQA